MQLVAAPGLACLRGRLSSSKIARIRVVRLISSSASRGSDNESFNVVCGSAGSITVDLYNSQTLTNPSSPLVIYLPPTGSHLSSKHPPIPTYLHSAIAALATINYRWNNPSPRPSSPKPLSSSPAYNNHPFPTPLHDTLYGYQFLINSLLPRFSPTAPQQNGRTSIYASPRPSKQQRPILIYGSFLGGTIATSLALTENFASKSLPTRIAGLIAKNAVFDWTEIATSLPPASPTSLNIKEPDIKQEIQQDVWDVKALHALKSHLFTTPASAFDPFASPTQFFRTAGLVIPPTWPTEEKEEEPKPPPTPNSNPNIITISDSSDSSSPTPSASDPHLATQEASTPSEPLSSSTQSEPETQSSRLGRRMSELQIQAPSRPAHLKFPPAASGLRIPRSLLLYTPSSTSPSPSSSPPASRTAKASAAKPKKKQKKSPSNDDQNDDEGELSPGGQAKTMASLLRRSVFLHEFADRKVWDEDLDPHVASEERALVLGVGGEEGGEEREVRRWIEECFG